jgi:hypothetical protein
MDALGLRSGTGGAPTATTRPGGPPKATGTVCQRLGGRTNPAAPSPAGRSGARPPSSRKGAGHRVRHLLILVTRPAPTVRPPSRIANRSPSSIAIGWISSTFIAVLSPGSTISVPSGSVTTPVTSVVRK